MQKVFGIGFQKTGTSSLMRALQTLGYRVCDGCGNADNPYFRSVLRRGDAVLDIGANFGFHTMLLSRLVGSTGRVIAFEPSPENL